MQTFNHLNAFIYSQKPLGFYCLGGDSRDRTGDLLLARQALSQLSYIPMSSRQAPYPSPQRLRYVSLSPLPLLSSHKRFAGLRSGLKVRFTLRKVVGPSGLEPPTLRLSVVRSSQLSYGPIQHSRVPVPSKLNNERYVVPKTV